jgi:methylisocitrate lyase
MEATRRLRKLLKTREVIVTTGAYDALSAKVIERAGIRAIITTGFGISASRIGRPDAELYTMTENLEAVKNMVATVDIPVLADLDTGYGNALNVLRTVREFERAGCAGGILEDQLSPKRCPACVDSFELAPAPEALGKIRAALDARRDPDFLIVARTDARGREAVDRANAYFEAGADLVLFISKAFSSFREMEMQTRALQGSFCLNYFEKIHYPNWSRGNWTMEDLNRLGVKFLNFPLLPLFAATQALQGVAEHLARHRGIRGLKLPKRMGPDQFSELIGFPQLSALQKKYLPSQDEVCGKKSSNEKYEKRPPRTTGRGSVLRP